MKCLVAAAWLAMAAPFASAQQASPTIAARLAALWPATIFPTFPPSAGTAPQGKEGADTLPSTVATHAEWTRDGKGFFYTSTPHPSQLYYHWTRRSRPDLLVYESPDGPSATVRGDMSSEGAYVIITATHPGDAHTRLAMIDLDDPDHPTIDAPFVKLYDDLDAMYHFVGSYGPQLYILTDRDAPRGKVMSLDATDPRPATEHLALAEGARPLVNATVVATRLFAVYQDPATGNDILRLFSLQGFQISRVPLPSPTSVDEIEWGGRQDHDTAYIAVQSILMPPTLYAYAVQSSQTTIAHAPPARLAFDSAQYRAQLVRYDSTGDTVSNTSLNAAKTTTWAAYVTARKSIARDGSHRVWIDTATAGGQSSMGANARLHFSPAAAVWIEQGGVYVVPVSTAPAALNTLVQCLIGQKYGTAETIVEGAAPPIADGVDAAAAWLTNQLR